VKADEMSLILEIVQLNKCLWVLRSHDGKPDAVPYT